MSRSHAVLRVLRKIHLYLGIFTAPALLFFAFTGALQTFSLHETTAGRSYKPPEWAVVLGQLHKKQTTIVPVRKVRPVTDTSKSEPAAGQTGGQISKAPMTSAAAPKGHIPMKIFFLLVSVGLFLSTLTGIYMAYHYSRSKLVISGVLAAGVVVPLLLLPF